MALQTTYVGIEPRTATATNVAQARGVRVTRNSSGVTAVTSATTRGDYVTLQAIAADASGSVSSMSGGGKVPALASEAATVGALAYAAASGKFSVTSTNAALVGRWTLAASGDGVLGEVELLAVA
jgi:hypothetical protein